MDVISRAMATLKNRYPHIDAPCRRKEFLNDRLRLAMVIAIEEYHSACAENAQAIIRKDKGRRHE